MSIDQSAKTPQHPARPGGEFFLRPDGPAHRRYEALRAYLAEGLPAGKAGPKTAPGKDAARPRILELRTAGHSIDEIAEALAAEGTPLNRTGIAEVIAAACPATAQPPPTPSSGGSCPPAGPSPATTTRSPSGSTGAPTHPCSARPACPKRSPSPGGKAGPSATSTPDPNWGPIRLVKIGANELPGPDHRPAGGHGSPIRRYVDGGQPSVRRPAIGTDGRVLRD